LSWKSSMIRGRAAREYPARLSVSRICQNPPCDATLQMAGFGGVL
jgi:hypothetical protein